MNAGGGFRSDRPVTKSFSILPEHYERLLNIVSYNKLHGLKPISASEIVREGLELYFEKHG